MQVQVRVQVRVRVRVQPSEVRLISFRAESHAHIISHLLSSLPLRSIMGHTMG